LCLSGCKPAAAIAPPTLTLDPDHPTAVWVRAELPDADCALQWSAGDVQPAGASLSARIEGDALITTLLGLPTDTEVRVTLDCPEGSSPAATLTTAALDDDVPTVTVTTAASGLTEPFFLHEWFQSGPSGFLTIEDLDGNVVWWESQGTRTATHAHVDPETHAVYAVEHGYNEPDGLVVAPMTGPASRWMLPGAHHDSLALGSGRYLLAVTEDQDVDGDVVAGDQLVVLDTADGSTTVVWDSFDQLVMERNDGWNFRRFNGAADWTHLNGLNLDPDTGKLYASLYWEGAVVQIDPTTWQTDWVLGGSQSAFRMDEPFGPQHSPVHIGDTLWLFDNGSDSSAGSRLARYTVDEATWTATRAWTWQEDPAVMDVVLGSVDPHDDALIASWGDSGTIRILDGQSKVIGEYDLGERNQVGYTSLLESLQ
jgi:hypothetical protein